MIISGLPNKRRNWRAALVVVLSLLSVICESAQAQVVEYIHTDSLGSPIAITDAARNVIERSEYAPYGQLLTPSAKDGPGFTGHVLDASTDLGYMQQRYYDPISGRFLSVDPITAYSNPVGALNRYWYANNNPYRFTDPDGRQSCVCSPEALVRTLNQQFKNSQERVHSALDGVDIRLEVSAAYGLGVEGDVSLMRGDGKISIIMAGEGAFVGLMGQPRQGYKLSLSSAVDSPIKIGGGPGVKAGAVLVGGVDAELNPGGSLEVKPKGGIGIGEVVKATPSISVLQWKGFGEKQSPPPPPPPPSIPEDQRKG